LVQEIREEYASLIPQMPYIGGKKNRLTRNLEGSAMFLAVYTVLKRHGKSAEEVGKIVYEMTQSWYRRYPQWLLRVIGRLRFSRFYASKLKKWAAESQKRRYPADFVYAYLKGDGKEFDFGVDYTECAICKFYRAQGAGEFAPYLCPLDYPISEALGFGMVRTKTLAEGADRCDFRFKRGRETVERLPWAAPKLTSSLAASAPSAPSAASATPAEVHLPERASLPG
jgi:hypothetical protein